jgi:hypothetical protein
MSLLSERVESLPGQEGFLMILGFPYGWFRFTLLKYVNSGIWRLGRRLSNLSYLETNSGGKERSACIALLPLMFITT